MFVQGGLIRWVGFVHYRPLMKERKAQVNMIDYKLIIGGLLSINFEEVVVYVTGALRIL